MKLASMGWLLVLASGAHALEGTVLQRGLRGPITGDSILYNIYLPAGYDSSTSRYPVIYHLHGIGGNQGGPQNNDVPAAFESAKAKGIIGPVIIVFPNSVGATFWADAKNGSKRAETQVIRELIPHVDANYRTLAAREQRVIEGFSMGGFGAAEYAGKFPELFRVCVVYDGALLNWSQMLSNHRAIVDSIFGNDSVYFGGYSPWVNWAVHAALLKGAMPIRMAVGALVDYNRAFRDHLQSLGVSPEYVETGSIHALPPLLASEGENNIRFIARYLGVPTAIADPRGRTGFRRFGWGGVFGTARDVLGRNRPGRKNP